VSRRGCKLCGGPSAEQKTAASSQADLNKTLADQFKAGSAVTNPFYQNLVEKGLPFFADESQYSTSSLAKDVNTQGAMMRNRLAGYGSSLPSGFAESSERDLAEGGAQAFDQNQLALLQANEAAKMGGAAGLNPLGKATAAQQGNQSIFSSPQLSNNFWSNVVGGLVSGASNIPFAFA
jgi:hypothetical protein